MDATRKLFDEPSDDNLVLQVHLWTVNVETSRFYL